MDIQSMKNIITIAFMVIVGLLLLVSIMTAYVFIKYGQYKHITLMITLAFAGVFLFSTIITFISLQKLF